MAEDPARYIIPDEHMVMMLEQYRAAGKKLFLLTNSLFDYTNVVMNFLTASEQGAQGRAWIDLFDVVIVGGCKPARPSGALIEDVSFERVFLQKRRAQRFPHIMDSSQNLFPHALFLAAKNE